MKLKIELSEEQLQLLINAIEVNFRIMMGQGDIAADLLSQCPDKSKFDDERKWNRAFDLFLLTRDFAGLLLKDVSRTLYKDTLHENTHRLSDMWSVLRHAQYNIQHNEEDYHDERSYSPFQMSDWDLMKVEVE